MNEKEFEQLVSWINACLHEKAIVILNDKLIDCHTNKKRQIDVSVRIKDGPTEILGIIEARKRSRKVGVEYIEQIYSKKKAVNADIAIIVSNKGFYNSALIKAEKYGIRTYSLDEALRVDWSLTINQMQYIIHRKIQGENPIVFFIDKEKRQVIDPHPSIIKVMEENGGKNLVFVDCNNNPFKSLNDFYQTGVNNEEFQKQLKKGKENSTSIQFYIEMRVEDKPYLLDKEENLREVNFFCIKGVFWFEEEYLLPSISQYKNKSNEILAEVINVKTCDKQSIEILIEKPNSINENRKLHFKIK